LRDGHPDSYLAHAARAGRLYVADDTTAAKQRLVEDWWQAAQHDLRGTVMLAYRRDDVRDLNAVARTLLIRAGQLGPVALEFGGHEFRIGDRVLCRRNDPRLGLRNGTLATVTELAASAITLRTDAGPTRPVPLAYAADHLERGYALTGHAAQGATVERSFVLLPDQGALREWGYVACTRARTETRLYLAGPELELESHARRRGRPGAPERATRALQRSAAAPLALDQTRTTARLLAEQGRRLDRQRRYAQERLAAAQARLDRLGWRARRRKAAELRAEITLYQATFQLADEKLNALTVQQARAHERVAQLPRRRALVQTRSRQPRLEQDPPGHGLDL
jgi:hypothetical protein